MPHLVKCSTCGTNHVVGVPCAYAIAGAEVKSCMAALRRAAVGYVAAKDKGYRVASEAEYVLSAAAIDLSKARSKANAELIIAGAS